MRTDVMPGAFNASFPADDPVQAAEVPTLPTQGVLPKAVPVAVSLVKLASTLPQATQPLGGRPKPDPLGKRFKTPDWPRSRWAGE